MILFRVTDLPFFFETVTAMDSLADGRYKTVREGEYTLSPFLNSLLISVLFFILKYFNFRYAEITFLPLFLLLARVLLPPVVFILFLKP